MPTQFYSLQYSVEITKTLCISDILIDFVLSIFYFKHNLDISELFSTDNYIINHNQYFFENLKSCVN